MSVFKGKNRIGTIPPDCAGLEVKIESSTCTGERTIGFFDPETRKLRYAELIRSQYDIFAFCERYGVRLDR